MPTLVYHPNMQLIGQGNLMAMKDVWRSVSKSNKMKLVINLFAKNLRMKAVEIEEYIDENECNGYNLWTNPWKHDAAGWNKHDLSTILTWTMPTPIALRNLVKSSTTRRLRWPRHYKPRTQSCECEALQWTQSGPSNRNRQCTIWTVLHNQKNQKNPNFQHSPFVTSKLDLFCTF